MASCQAAMQRRQRLSRPPKRMGLDWVVRVLKAVPEFGGPFEGEVGIGVGV